MIFSRKILLLVILLVGLAVPPVVVAQTDDEPVVVRAVLFYSPTCPHCHAVINELIIPMTEEYGRQLQIVGIDTTQPAGSDFYQKAIERFEIPDQRRGVPTLIIDDVVLVGSGEIPAEFPDLVKAHLAAGSNDWPDIPGLAEALTVEEDAQSESEAAAAPSPQPEAARPEPTPTNIPQATPTSRPTDTPAAVAEQSVLTIDKDSAPPVAEAEVPPADPIGVALAAAILIGMLAALVWVGWRLMAGRLALLELSGGPINRITGWALPLLCLIGLGVSIYLAYVEINQVDAVCGPVGHCNVVQSSVYARLLGVPIAVWGMLNYVALIGLWAIQKYSSGTLAGYSLLALVVLTIWSTLFSIYLTALEIFVINAVCMWCLSSALISTGLMLLVIVPVTGTTARIQAGSASA